MDKAVEEARIEQDLDTADAWLGDSTPRDYTEQEMQTHALKASANAQVAIGRALLALLREYGEVHNPNG